MSFDEAQLWLTYFRHPSLSKDATMFQECSQLPSKIAEELAKRQSSNHSSVVLQLHWRRLLLPLLRWTHSMEKKVGGGGSEHVFQPAFALLERTRVSLDII